MEDSPVLVCGPRIGGLPELDETGFCVYDLQRMHDEHAAGDVAVLEVDFYRADSMVDLGDEELSALALKAASAALGVPAATLDPSLVVDAAVVRAREAVSHFAIGSAALSPDVRLGPGIFACGDWIDRCGHASWSTEKAVVTAKQASGAVAAELQLDGVDKRVIPAADDTAALASLRRLARTARAAVTPAAAAVGRDVASELPPPAPWALLQSLRSGLSGP